MFFDPWGHDANIYIYIFVRDCACVCTCKPITIRFLQMKIRIRSRQKCALATEHMESRITCLVDLTVTNAGNAVNSRIKCYLWCCRVSMVCGEAIRKDIIVVIVCSGASFVTAAPDMCSRFYGSVLACRPARVFTDTFIVGSNKWFCFAEIPSFKNDKNSMSTDAKEWKNNMK